MHHTTPEAFKFFFSYICMHKLHGNYCTIQWHIMQKKKKNLFFRAKRYNPNPDDRESKKRGNYEISCIYVAKAYREYFKLPLKRGRSFN